MTTDAKCDDGLVDSRLQSHKLGLAGVDPRGRALGHAPCMAIAIDEDGGAATPLAVEQPAPAGVHGRRVLQIPSEESLDKVDVRAREKTFLRVTHWGQSYLTVCSRDVLLCKGW